MQLSGKLLMHFKPFWMPCLHIIFFTSTPIPELIAVENFTKRWNGILASLEIPAASLVGFQHDRFEQVGLKISLYVTGAAYGSVWGISSHMRGNLEPRLIRSKKSSCQTWLESRDQKWGEKVLVRSEVVFHAGAKLSEFRFFLLLLLRFLVGQSIYPEFICYRILFFWKICLSDKLALTDDTITWKW